jgi:transcriptional regulator with XRE-family HTH domain
VSTIKQKGAKPMQGKIHGQLNLKKTNEEGEAVLEYFRKQVKKARIEAGLSQRAMSIKVTKSFSYINQVENGSIEPGITEMLAIAIILKKPLFYFFPPRYRDKEDKILYPEQYDLMQIAGQTENEELRQAMVESARTFASIKS